MSYLNNVLNVTHLGRWHHYFLFIFCLPARNSSLLVQISFITLGSDFSVLGPCLFVLLDHLCLHFLVVEEEQALSKYRGLVVGVNPLPTAAGKDIVFSPYSMIICIAGCSGMENIRHNFFY